MTKFIIVHHIHGISVRKTLGLILTIISEGFSSFFNQIFQNSMKIVKILFMYLLRYIDFVKVNLMISFCRYSILGLFCSLTI